MVGPNSFIVYRVTVNYYRIQCKCRYKCEIWCIFSHFTYSGAQNTHHICNMNHPSCEFLIFILTKWIILYHPWWVLILLLRTEFRKIMLEYRANADTNAKYDVFSHILRILELKTRITSAIWIILPASFWYLSSRNGLFYIIHGGS